MPARDNMIIMKRERPKRVILPDGQTFFARFKGVTMDHLPVIIRMKRHYRQRVAPQNRRRCCQAVQ